MKKSFAVLALVLVCAMLVPCFASAVSFTAQADAMKDMGLFLGTNNGYDLDKAPTRAQAAVMLVRFLGKEAEAKEGEWETPFTDVPDWAKPYVGYLYENDLTKGMSETTYVPDDVCSAQMYATFILRALGYMDENGKDTFEYAKVFEFAEEKNLITAENCDKDNFLRDHMVGIAYKALTLPTADGAYEALVTKLAADGVVTAEQAAKVLDGSYIPEEGGNDQPSGEVEEAQMEFAAWSENGYTPIFVTTKNMYDTLIYTGDTVEMDGVEWNVVDINTVNIILDSSVDATGKVYNYAGQWGAFFRDTVNNLGITDEAAVQAIYTTIYDVDDDGVDEYCFAFNYGAIFSSSFGAWGDWNNTILWDTADGSECTPITFLMKVTIEW